MKFENIEEYLNYIDREPPKTKVLKSGGKEWDYVPVDVIDKDIKEVFNGMIDDVEFYTQLIVNELLGTYHFKLLHPVTNKWMNMIGVASVMIPQYSGSKADEFPKNKISNGLGVAIKSLKSKCRKNAFSALGKRYGQGINRKKEELISDFAYNKKNEFHDSIKIKIEKGVALNDAERNYALNNTELYNLGKNMKNKKQ